MCDGCGARGRDADCKRKKMRNVNVGTMVFLGIMLMIFQIPTIIGEKEEGTDGNGE